jgi:hypothetical protein
MPSIASVTKEPNVRAIVVLGCLSVLASACGDDSSIAPGRDGGPGPSVDAASPDAGAIDAGFDAGPRPDAPPLYTESELEGDALAREALRILGSRAAGGMRSCSECHGITRRRVRTWAEQTTVVLDTCLTDQEVTTDASASAMLECVRGIGPTYRPDNIGIFAAAADLEWFRYVFERGTGADWETEHETFVDRAGMPAESRTPLTQEQFDIIATWFVAGAPNAEAILPADPAPAECMPFVSPLVATHAARMAEEGWGALNREAGILMYGCAGAASPGDCLSTAMAARDTTFGAGWDVVEGSTSRLLHTTSYGSSFWTRSSADGRFVSHGPGYTVDLMRGAEIRVDAPYDPGFFPDNSAFVWPGVVCEQSLLTRMPGSISLSEPECTSASIGLYEHVGVGLGGEDYWVITGEFSSDDGGHSVTREDPSAYFSRDSTQTLTRMVNDGTGFRPGGEVSTETPYEGDAAISPSSELMLSRIAGPGDQPIGYSLYRIGEIAGGSVTLHEVGRYCEPGAKIAFSFDERWAIYHHYIDDDDAIDLGFTDASDPGFAMYRSRGAANVYLIDLTTGERTRITNMGPGQYALFPHFRSDGWIYYMVRGATGVGGERVMATDAALVLSGG